MKPTRSTWRRSVGCLAAIVVVSLAFVAPNAAPAGAETGEDDPLVVRYPGGPALDEPSVTTVEGSPTGDGGCNFSFPSLELAPHETAVEARQIETNFDNCTTKVEVGTPRDAPPATAAVSSSGYYRVWWEDIVHLRVHEVKSNISWTWDGSCVTSSNGSADYWWLSGTGWYKDSSSSTILRSCANTDVNSNATYRNGTFCAPGTVWSYYHQVHVRGRNDGWLLGAVGSTWTTYPWTCLPLHYHTELRRVTG